MSSYSSFTIDGVDLYFDPNSVSVNYQNIVSIDKSLGGTSYVTTVNSNTVGVNKTVSVSGDLLPATYAIQLATSAAKKTSVVVTGDVSWLTPGTYVILSLNLSPMKPRMDTPDNSDIKYAYTISLQEVDA